MESGTYYLEKMIKHIKKITFGMKYPVERFNLFNKFGLLYDELNKHSSGWIQKAGQEAGSQLLNLFDYVNEKNNQGIFVSTSRIGFSLSNLNLKKIGVEQALSVNLPKLNDLYKTLFNVFDEFTFSRFGIYFEFLLSENDVQGLSKINLIRWLLGNNKISDFEEIDQRFSYIITPKQEINYHKLILQFRKVINKKDNDNPEINYLLTTDFQNFFDQIKINSAEELENFVSDKFASNYKLFNSHFSELTTVKENS